ncbi:peptidoglycan-binding domain-containing protein [Nocardiopsis salina]|uniref:peptidoglycan-binding domain-containing protein n=1 Tax=Nocardiopsis salina TaxID=245836 RepID=UPI00047623A8|nr:peptidoglycan-binding domain-containing protein [Nocardiopsis salina]
MSARTHIGFLGRTVAVAGAGLMAFTASVATAPTAGADDLEHSSAQVIAQIEAQPWPFYEQGEIDPDIRAAYRALGQNGYESTEETSEFGEPLQEQVDAYQADNEQYLPQTGDLDDETWLLLREQTYGSEYLPGDGPDNGRTWGVLGIQELLMTKHGADIDNDGWYGEETFYAVCDAQEHYGLEPDGFVGRLTWRALITDQDWDEDAARAVAEAEVPDRAPAGFLRDAEAAAAQYDCANRP